MNAKVEKRARKSKQPEVKGSGLLLSALKFVAEAQAKEGSVYQTHCILQDNTLTAFNGVLTIGVRIPESLNCCPHTFKLISALNNCGESLSMTQLESGKLSVKSGAFKALVDCVAWAEMPSGFPDPMIAPASNALKAALSLAAPLVSEGAARAFAGAVLVQANSVVATNGFCLIEAWHGIDMPPEMLLPKVSAAVIAKCDKNVVGFGFSATSLTIWFEDESFIKSQLFKEHYPNVYSILKQADDPSLVWHEISEELFKGVEALEPFCDGFVVFKENKLASSPDDSTACTYAIQNIPCGFGLGIQYLKMVKIGMIKIADLGTNIHFIGNGTRGAIAKRSIK